MNSKILIITFVFAFLSMGLTFQPTRTMAQTGDNNTGANTSGVNITTTGTNMMTGDNNTGANTSGVNLTTTD
jgi:ribose/xylose/arabinose/galactoside ABC-type transport system permease subunit